MSLSLSPSRSLHLHFDQSYLSFRIQTIEYQLIDLNLTESRLLPIELSPSEVTPILC
jgi:hypothetical protein